MICCARCCREPEPAEPAPGLRSSRRRRHRLPRALQSARAAPAQLRQHKRPTALRAWRHLQRSQVQILDYITEIQCTSFTICLYGIRSVRFSTSVVRFDITILNAHFLTHAGCFLSTLLVNFLGSVLLCYDDLPFSLLIFSSCLVLGVRIRSRKPMMQAIYAFLSCIHVFC